MALLAADGDAARIVASEGGHADFAPRNEDEVGLWRFLAGRYGRVSIERVVSGPGLSNIYDHLRQTGLTEPAGLSARLHDTPDRAAVIAQAGLSGDVPICARALELFLSAYGAAAGNLALTALANGGLYLGGGIAPKLLPMFPTSDFMAAFVDKGRFADLLADVPVRIILEPKTALRGAASMALAS
jgi:glucokinase